MCFINDTLIATSQVIVTFGAKIKFVLFNSSGKGRIFRHHNNNKMVSLILRYDGRDWKEQLGSNGAKARGWRTQVVMQKQALDLLW